jgi:hypothetical protein
VTRERIIETLVLLLVLIVVGGMFWFALHGLGAPDPGTP